MGKKNWPKLFPYEPRDNQKVVMEHIIDAMAKQGHVIAESGTGSGKTVCSLAPTLEYSLKNRTKVLYLTRTNSQQKQVILELRKINEKKAVFGVGLQGRQNVCRMMEDRPELKTGTAEELSKLCGDLKKATLDGGTGCKYYANLLNGNFGRVRKKAMKTIPTVEDFAAICREEGDICSYEANKMLLKDTVVVTAPYIYFFSGLIRHSLLDWMNVHISDLIVIVDEAHNLANYARELYSRELSARAMELAVLEAGNIGDPFLAEDLKLSDFCTLIGEVVHSLASEYIIDEDGLIPPNEVETYLMSHFRMTSRELNVLIANMITHGDIIRERKRKRGKLPRSHIYKAATFLQDWMLLEETEYAKLISGDENPRLEAYCLNPAKATGVLNDCHTSIHMSGTLSPLVEYRDSIGLPRDTDCISLPSPFAKENRLILYTDELTTKYERMASDEEMVPRMKEVMLSVTRRFEKNTIIFFPSFALLSRFSDLAPVIGRNCFFEEQGMSQDELMSTVHNFKLGKGSVMFSVMGGRISEGIDFPSNELEIALLVGIPFPKPTAKQRSLLKYYDIRFGKGWEYTVKAPTVRKIMQSIGRLLRRETDRGVALVLDSRMVQFKEEIPEVRLALDPVGEMAEFFS